MRVRYFATCLGDRLFPDAALDGVWLLRSLGVEVEIALDATCCGQPAWNAGHREPARDMARGLLDALGDDDPVDLPAGGRGADGHGAAASATAEDGAVPVVLPSGSCAAMLRGTFPRLGLPSLPAFELSAFLVRELGVTELGRGLAGLRVAYHHGCHALRETGVRDEPLRLLENAGAEVVSWEAAEECCGFGGLFAAKLPHVSAAMADRKLDTLPARVDALTSADGGCLLQLGGRAGFRGAGATAPAVEVVHLATLLRRAREAEA